MKHKHSIAILKHAVCPILGVDADRALDIVPWPPTTRLGADLNVSGTDFVTLWNTIVELAGEKADPMFLGRAMANGPIVPIFLAFAIAPNLNEALRRLARYKSLFGPVAINLSPRRGGIRIELTGDAPEVTLPPSLAVPIGVFIAEKARSHTALHVVPTQVSLPVGVVDPRTAADFFGTEVKDGGQVVLEYSAADSQARFVSENNELWLEIERDLETQMTRRLDGQTFVDQVETLIRRALNVGPVSVDAICDELEISRSTLQRRLLLEGQAYQDILDRVRWELAARYLTKSVLLPSQIAGLVGFSDPKSFHRAFKAWTNQTPESFRKAAAR